MVKNCVIFFFFVQNLISYVLYIKYDDYSKILIIKLLIYQF